MSKVKISATIDPVRLASAKQLVDEDNVSAVLDQALSALIEREQERRWLAAHPSVDRAGPTGDGVPDDVVPDLTDLAWDV